jgi:2-dehydro-3-deoxyglucarate aldolase
MDARAMTVKSRMEMIRAVREKLRGGGVSVGSWMQIPHGSVAEILGRAGYDWVAADLEHGSFSNHQLPDIFRALELGGTLPLARVAQGQPKDCKLALDAGAGGVIIPMIESAAQLQSVVNACRWPPAGSRGVGFSRANLFGGDFNEYAGEAQAPLLVAMIEHERAVDDLEGILKVPGVDALLVGPYDLSASMGLTAQFDHPRFTQIIQRIVDTARRIGVPCGVHVVDPDETLLEQRIQQGYRFIAYSIDAVFLRRSSAVPAKK